MKLGKIGDSELWQSVENAINEVQLWIVNGRRQVVTAGRFYKRPAAGHPTVQWSDGEMARLALPVGIALKVKPNQQQIPTRPTTLRLERTPVPTDTVDRRHSK